ncbi:MAG: glycosyltransferase [Planctomycetes bacterium]|nr:glycosyltransferase [Planctomycetota bacterium]
MSEPLLTAMVSTYASERYLAGCLDDLLQQTIAARIEIVVVDAASPEREGELVRAYQRHAPNLRYVRAETREGTSAAFRRATALARGRYLTTANTDDRHHPEFAARMVEALERHPEFGLCYADSLITQRDNETWQVHTAHKRYAWPDYTPATALSCCLFGAQAVWRRSVHTTVGDWDDAHPFANDQDMFLRIARRFGAVHLRAPLGLFLQRPDSQSGSGNRRATLADVLAVLRKHRSSWSLDEVFPALQRDDTPAARAAAWFELGNLCALGPYTDAELALQCYERGLREPTDGAAAAQIRAAFANNTGCVLACAGAALPAQRAFGLCDDVELVADNRERLQRRRQRGGLPRLDELRFAQPEHAVVHAARRARALVLGDDGGMRWSASRAQVPWSAFPGADGVPIAQPAEPARRAAVVVPRPGPHVMLVMYGWADSGGGTILPRAVARQLAAAGHRVSVVSAAARPDPALPPYAVRREHEDGVDLFAIVNRPSDFLDPQHPEREIDDPAVRTAFAALLDERRPDVVHFWNLHNLGLSLPGECRQRGIPTVLSSNNYWALCPRAYLFDAALRRCEGGSDDGKKCARCVGTPAAAPAHAARRRAAVRMLRGDIDVHLAVSQRVRELYVQNGDEPGHVRVLRQEPPEVAAIWQRTGSRRAITAELRRPLRVGFFGSVLPHKGLHVLVQALQLLPEVPLVAVALGDADPGYAARLAELDRLRRLHLHGPYPPAALPELLATVDVVVVPSVWDDCAPYVVAEALAARCPVVGSAAGGIPDFVRAGHNGLLFPPGDAAALAACLRSFVQDPRQLGRMQAAIEPPRGLPAFTAELLAVYRELEPAAGRLQPA